MTYKKIILIFVLGFIIFQGPKIVANTGLFGLANNSATGAISRSNLFMLNKLIEEGAIEDFEARDIDYLNCKKIFENNNVLNENYRNCRDAILEISFYRSL